MSEEQGLDLTLLEVEDLIGFFIGLLSRKALNHMGIPLKEGDTPEKDLTKASVAINCITCLTDQAEPITPEETMKQYRALIGDLQLNYVRAS
ncbi:hypothetical protein JXL21_13935 [Candidatus Bathyarchaeota archaeon]|nr:hypothetical protein [Candidatus Bathyarchaeota archaeon]